MDDKWWHNDDGGYDDADFRLWYHECHARADVADDGADGGKGVLVSDAVRLAHVTVV